jgi:hypothetical protein
VTAELNNALLGVDVRARRVVHTIDIGGAAHWVVAHPDGRRLYASCKQTPNVAVVDLATRRVSGQITIPNRCEGMALAADGEYLYVASHAEPEVNVIDTRSDRLVKSLRFEGAGAGLPQLRRARLSPDRRWLLLSSSKDQTVAVFRLPSLEQTALIAVGRAPMGFAFPDAPDRALLCNHDDGAVSVLDLANGAIESSFASGNGCEYADYFTAQRRCLDRAKIAILVPTAPGRHKAARGRGNATQFDGVSGGRDRAHFFCDCGVGATISGQADSLGHRRRPRFDGAYPRPALYRCLGPAGGGRGTRRWRRHAVGRGGGEGAA